MMLLDGDCHIVQKNGLFRNSQFLHIELSLSPSEAVLFDRHCFLCALLKIQILITPSKSFGIIKESLNVIDNISIKMYYLLVYQILNFPETYFKHGCNFTQCQTKNQVKILCLSYNYLISINTAFICPKIGSSVESKSSSKSYGRYCGTSFF